MIKDSIAKSIMAKKESALGKGLGALLGDAQNVEQVREQVRGISEINVNDIEVNPYQPRINFDEDALNELAESIKEHGIIQPITVRQISDRKYQIISGERRFKASKIAGLRKIPAYIRTSNDQGMLELALIENIQREDLDAIEVATSFNRLIEECNLTQESLGSRVGKKRATVTNYLRLLKLPAEIQLYIRNKQMSMGQARAILNIDDVKLQGTIAKKIVDESWSVRQVEDMVRKLTQPAIPKETEEQPIEEFPEKYYKLTDALRKYFNSNVNIKPDKSGGGRIVITFNSEVEIDKLLEKLDAWIWE
ncbi:MAG: ParB/RepB/Spo0J family partition protein [Prevotellaceae bacterium]|jgi:ParB family chromosome partitioning protein|nr:ParB/RepB/Spo0J family partition protein [Prevotellaceae bacterium]